ncbi:hypothetical protein KIL84_010473 [Mauremys mutica]|uniref:Uncharacterized protein n=1 Tax=Mauremys mutica TaxID=74926 RepID=A0A9D3XBW6_9SAUR|nr:hypothetical protein KIL84_010473 [Mauremys mutica]
MWHDDERDSRASGGKGRLPPGSASTVSLRGGHGEEKSLRRCLVERRKKEDPDAHALGKLEPGQFELLKHNVRKICHL